MDTTAAMLRTLFADKGRGVLSRRVRPPLSSRGFHSRLRWSAVIFANGMASKSGLRHAAYSWYRSMVLGGNFFSTCCAKNSSRSIESVLVRSLDAFLNQLQFCHPPRVGPLSRKSLSPTADPGHVVAWVSEDRRREPPLTPAKE